MATYEKGNVYKLVCVYTGFKEWREENEESCYYYLNEEEATKDRESWEKHNQYNFAKVVTLPAFVSSDGTFFLAANMMKVGGPKLYYCVVVPPASSDEAAGMLIIYHKTKNAAEDEAKKYPDSYIEERLQ